MLKNGATKETERESGNSLSGIISQVYDQYYVSDLTDDGLESIYKLLHSESGKNVLRESDPAVADLLKAELTMRREFQLRELALPEMSKECILNKMFDSVAGMSATEDVEKANDADTVYSGTTEPDAVDGHTHVFKNLERQGSGVTDEAGDADHKHSHNISHFVTLPIQLSNGYKSDHPGKVKLKTQKGDFKVTKRLNDYFEWEANVDLFKVDLEKQLVGGIVYEPEIVDAQGDSSSDGEIEKACHNYMVKSMTVGKMHTEKLSKDEVVLVENYIAPTNFYIGQEFVRKGSWVQVHKVLDKQLWSDIKDGKYTGLSMAGRAKDISPKNKEKSVFEQQKLSLEKAIKSLKGQKSPALQDASKAISHMDKYMEHMEAGRTDQAKGSLDSAHSYLSSAADKLKLGSDHPAAQYLESAGQTLDHYDNLPKKDPDAKYKLGDAAYQVGNAHRALVSTAVRMKKSLEVSELNGGRLGGLISLLKMDLEKMIKKVGEKFYVYTKDGSRKLGGPFDDREKALKMLSAVEANKHLTAKHLVESDIQMEKGGPGSGRHGSGGKKPMTSAQKGHADFLRNRLAPDYKASGREASAEDATSAADHIENPQGKKSSDFANYLQNRLAPDLHESGRHSEAKDFERAAKHINNRVAQMKGGK